MSNFLYKLKKISKMNPSVVIKKLLSYDEVFVTGYRKRTDNLLFQSAKAEFNCVTGDKDFWYADPILFTKDGRSYLFMEAFDKKANLGRVAYCELTDKGATAPQLVLVEPFHMSFPTVFAFNNDIYMLPETSADKSLRLYKAVDFPTKWELVKRFDMGRLFVDTVTTHITDKGFSILTCEISPYKEYECRFQKFDICREEDGNFTISENKDFNTNQEYDLKSRNGGAIFELQGKRYVAAQESSSSEYGLYMDYYEYRDDTKRIATTPQYRVSAKNVTVVGAPKGEGVHSYCFNDEYEIIDLKYLEFTPGKLRQRLFHR